MMMMMMNIIIIKMKIDFNSYVLEFMNVLYIYEPFFLFVMGLVASI